ncbi:MAG: SPOR domain-containing protein [Gammaproteobacteria bacterium]|nr:SPOR domain-containing protein [Gammaproteobacteria bacterium]MCP5137469.1 SPOR domain-containing protein [Gammaproteobacteria bacterium]
MDPQLKQRLVGAAVLLSLAVIFLPLILSGPPPSATQVVRKEIPPEPNTEFESRVMPLTPPRLNQPVAKVVIGEDDGDPAANLEDEVPSAETPSAAKAPVTKAGLRAWAVQVGTFSGEENALTMSQDLRAKGYSAFVQSQQGAKGKIWFVRVGPELQRDDADALMEKLRSKQRIKDAYVVRYP